MGSCSFRSNGLDNNDTRTHHLPYFLIIILVMTNKGHFTFEYVIGRGGFGKVNKT